MKYLSISLLSLLSCVVTVFMFVVAYNSQKELHKYQQYYRASEELLDSLEANFNWLDAYDPGITYDKYIESRKNLKK